MRGSLRRGLAAVLSSALVVVSPGFECYQAFGAQLSQSGKVAPSSPRVAALPGLTLGVSPNQPGAMAAGASGQALGLGPADSGLQRGRSLGRAAPGAVASSPGLDGLAAASPLPALSPNPAASLPSARAGQLRAQEVLALALADLAKPGLGPEATHEIGRRLADWQARQAHGDVAAKAGTEHGFSAPGRSLAKPAGPAGTTGRKAEVGSPSVATSIMAAFMAAAMTIGCGAQSNQLPPEAIKKQAQVQETKITPEVQVADPVTATLEIDRQGVTVGERVRLILVVKNNTQALVTVSGLRSALEGLIQADLELASGPGDEAILLAPGETRIVFEAIPFDSGSIKFGGKLVLALSGAEKPLDIVLPETILDVKSVLTPDWKEKGFRDIDGVKRREVPKWPWLAALPLLLLLLIGAERLLAFQKARSKLPPGREPLLAEIRRRIEALEDPAKASLLSAPEYYAEFSGILTTFLVDYLGLPTREREAADLAKDLKASKRLGSGQLEVAGLLARRSQDFRFNPRSRAKAEDPAQRGSDVRMLKDLIVSVVGEAQARSQGRSGALQGLALGILPGAAALQWANPWALALLAIPAGYLLWKWLSRKRGAAYTVPSRDMVPAKKSLRQRFFWLPAGLRAAAIALIVTALAHPQLGITRQDTFIPSTDNIPVLDISGSMDSPYNPLFPTGESKLEAAKEAIKAYILEQRRGSTNRVGLLFFADEPYQGLRLTTDYDALVSYLKEIETTGSTAVGEAILSAIGHFLEINARELDLQDPRVEEVKKLLRSHRLGAAITYLKDHADLAEKVLRPDRKKVVIVFTDGQSNSGTSSPVDAAKLAKLLGVKIYAVGIAPPGVDARSAGLDERTLGEVARITGAQYYRAGDPERMKEVLLEISRIEKSPVKIVSTLAAKDFQTWLILLALLALGLELGLSNTRLRALHGALVLALPLGLLGAPEPAQVPAQPKQPAAVVQDKDKAQEPGQEKFKAGREPLPLTGVPESLSSGNLLYAQGRFEDALKKYADALERYPDLPEIYFNMGNAYLRLGETERALAAYQKFLSANPSPALASRAFFNMGNTALAAGDAEAALEHYKEALRCDPDNADAKWNLEVLKKLMQEQEGQGKGKGRGNRQGRQRGQQEADQQGEQQADGESQKEALEQLGEKLSGQEQRQEEAHRKAITRRGSGMWGAMALPLLAAGGEAAFTLALPTVLWVVLAVVLPILAGAMVWGLHKRLKAARQLSPGTSPKGFGSWWGKRRWWGKLGLSLGAAALLGLAAADPRSGTRDTRINFGGKDIIVTVDGSHSMLYAEDGRQERTQRELAEFFSKLRGADRIGLVVFAGKARTASPLSVDTSNFEYKVDRLEIESRGLAEGSDLAEAVKFAAASFDNAKKIKDRTRFMIVISDGDIFEQELEEAVKAAHEHKVAVYTIGVGNPAGTKMKVPTEDGTGTEYLIDSETGAPALTRLKEEPLRLIAERTGGKYFRAEGDTATISRILETIAQAQKGEKGDEIKSPRSLALIPLSAALLLLLLDLLLPGRSALKEEKGPGGKKSGRKASMAGGLILGAALVPLHAWPVILPLAVLLALAGGFLLADILSRGALMRRLAWSWQRRARAVEKGALADSAALFDLREIDAQRLKDFLAAWSGAKEEARRAMIPEAAVDPQLWREKLVAAYLHGSSLETQEALLWALANRSRERVESPEPVILKSLSRRGKLPWLDHVDAARRLSVLSQAWLDPEKPESAAALRSLAKAPRPRTWLGRLALAFSLVFMTGMLTLVGAAGLKTAQYVQERAAAAEASLRLFYGEDMYIFTDSYADERIPADVLPALRRWHQDPGAGGAAKLERAVGILAKSLDPRADNLLEVIFKRADFLPLTDKASYQLMAALADRENELVWKAMEEQMARAERNPKALLRMQRMVAIAAILGTDTSFANSFRFLKAPNPHLAGVAYEAIYKSLVGARSAEFNDRLLKVQSKFADDVVINLWIESFLLRRLASAGPGQMDQAKSRQLINAALHTVTVFDLMRAQAKASLKPGEQDQTPPAALLAFLDVMEESLDASQQGKPAGSPLPAALAEMVKHGINESMARLVISGDLLFDRLIEKLQAAGVTLPGTRQYRSRHKLAHIREMRRLVAEEGKAAGDKATPQMEEYLERADKALQKLEALGRRAGMREGGSAADRVAEDLNPLLAKGYGQSNLGVKFLAELRKLGLAPDNGATAGEELWLEAYSLGDLKKLRQVFLDIAKGAIPLPLAVIDKQYLNKGLEELDKIIEKHYPQPKGKDRQTFWKALAAPGEEGLALVRLAEAMDARMGDKEFQAQAMDFLVSWLKKPGVPNASAEEVSMVLTPLLKGSLKTAQAVEFLDKLAKALKARSADSPLALGARESLQTLADDVIQEASEAFPELKGRAVEVLGDRLVVNPLPGLFDLFTGAMSQAPAVRLEYKLIYLKDFKDLVRENLAAVREPSAEQKAAAERVETLIPRIIAAGLKAGIPAGDTPAELVAEPVNAVLFEGYEKFYGRGFTKAMAAAGLMPENSDIRLKDTAFKTKYSRAELVKIREFLKELQASGQGWLSDEERRPLDDVETEYLQRAISVLDDQIKNYPKEGVKLYSFAPLALALAMPGFSGLLAWIAAGVAALGLVWGLYCLARRLLRRQPKAQPLILAAGPSEEVMRRYKEIELMARKLATSVAFGSFRSRRVGPGGSEQADIKPYEGEEVKDIDQWATARMGEVQAKTYELEKRQTLWLVADLSASSGFGTGSAEKRRVIEDSAAALALAAASQSLPVGLVIVTDKVELQLPPRAGKTHAQELIRRLLEFEPEARGTDLGPALDLVAKRLSARGMVMVLSDFISKDFRSALSGLIARHEVHILRVSDPAERKAWPEAGLIRLKDAETGEVMLYDSSAFRAEQAALLVHREAKLAQAFAGASVLELSTAGGHLESLVEHFDPKGGVR